jgi:AraC-like DNA-binding protein
MLLSLSLLGLILSAILLYFNARNYKSSIYLSLFFFLISLYSFSQYVLLYSKSVFLVSIIPGHFGFLFYLAGPMLYWYIRSVLTDDYHLKKKDLWHFLPMVIYFVAVLPYIFSSFASKVEIAREIVKDISFLQQYKFTVLSDIFSVHAVYLSRPLILLGYTIWSVTLFIQYLISKGELFVFSHQHFMTKWISVFLIFNSIMIVCHFLLMLKPVSVFATLNVLQILSAAGLMGLLISPFFFPDTLYGLPRFPESTATLKPKESELDTFPGVPRKSTNHFESGYLLDINQKADSCMKQFQPYLQPDFNLTQFSVLVHIPTHHLAYYFREEKKQSFIDYRNIWRVNHAKTLIKEGKASDLTLEAIGLLSGFSNRNTFFIAFKKAEGISPGAFVNQYTV